MRRLVAEAVVVGGGAAGTFAALELHRRGVKPLILCKGLVGKSGASIFAGNLVVPGRLLGNTEQQARDTAEFLIRMHNHFLIDQHYARAAGEWIEREYYPELERAGLYLRRDDRGVIVTNDGPVRCMAAHSQGESGVLFMDLRRKQVLQAGIPWLEETAVTALLTDAAGAIAGVVALDLARGEAVAIAAPAVILATGYADRLYPRSTATREMSADGIAMAWRAGAELMNLEIQWWHTSDVRFPLCWQRTQVYPNPIIGSSHSARLYNGDGEVFFDQEADAPAAMGPYTLQLKCLAKQVLAGKARFDGGYYSGFTHVAPAAVAAYTDYAKAFAALGKSTAADTLETACSAHYRQGGIVVDPATMATRVPGLYVAGGVGGHSNGLIAPVTYDGMLAAETVANGLPRLKPAAFPEDKAVAEAARLHALRRPLPVNGVTPARVKQTLRALMGEKMGFFKDVAGMEAALVEVMRLRDELLPAMGLTNVTPRLNYAWLDAIDVANLLEVAALTIRGALHRTESRGPFYRTDFPQTDNARWLAKNILTPTADGDVRFRTEPYELPFFKPDFVRRESLEVAW
ncbi:MAG: FAD-dependent oxidoreductase [Stellaceae bacterium]